MCQILPEIQHLIKVMDSIQIQPNIKDFWKLETIGISEPDEMKEDDKLVMEHYNNAVKKVGRRYQVSWPWKDKSTKLPDNYELSVGRFKSLYKKLNRDLELQTIYDEVIENQLNKGNIEMVTKDKEEGDR